jgi:hypothetical protein
VRCIGAYTRCRSQICAPARSFRRHAPASLPTNTHAKCEPPALWAGGFTELPITAPSGRTPKFPGPGAIPQRGEYPLAADICLEEFCDLYKALSAGARWITVRPNGDGAFRVIGGASEKLNYLKLTGVRSEAEYTQRSKEKATEHRAAKKRRTDRDHEAGLLGVTTQARDNLRLADHAARDDFVK